jgi:hypothetical protein
MSKFCAIKVAQDGDPQGTEYLSIAYETIYVAELLLCFDYCLAI